jgi:hypothetical protein
VHTSWVVLYPASSPFLSIDVCFVAKLCHHLLAGRLDPGILRELVWNRQRGGGNAAASWRAREANQLVDARTLTDNSQKGGHDGARKGYMLRK